ncbi:MAG: hypothetical protein WDA16_06960 [Candidatus Thermoplasmatota archaeon]
MSGKDPHRPEGKTLDAEHQIRRHMREIIRSPSTNAGRAPEPRRFPAEEQLGGSRPGVESRVRRAIEEREERR